jgi:hypothetical protein
MSLDAGLRALGLIRRLAPGSAPPLAPRARDVEGVACDWYEPPRPRGPVVVALHGLTLNGKDDPRLRAFAGALASVGATCVLPTLPALASARWDAGDVTAVARVAAAAHAAGRRAVLVGFSHGASVGLVAAASPEGAPHVARVLAFGAYHSLARALAGVPTAHEPSTDAAWEALVYAHLLHVHRHGGELGLTPALRADAASLLRRYCDAESLAEKRRFFEGRLRSLRLLPDGLWPEPPAVCDAVSPAGRLGGLACPVDLVHDAGDDAVAVSEAHALLAELRTTAGAKRHRLLVTPLVAHVTPSAALRPLEGLLLLRMVAAMLEG